MAATEGMFADRGAKREADSAAPGAPAGGRPRPTQQAEATRVPHDNDAEMLPFHALMCKFMLAQGLSSRMLISACIDVISLLSSSVWAISATAEGKGYSERTKGRKGHDEGPPHPHIWNSLLMATAKDPALEPGDQDLLNAYAQAWKGKGPLALCDEIRCCRTKKCFDTKYLNLFVKVREGTQSAVVWGIIKKRMVLTGSIMREGLAPQSNMEREIEKFLELFKSR